MNLPAGGGQLFVKDPVSGESMYIDSDQFAKEYSTISKTHLDYVRNVFKKIMGDCLVLKNGEDPTSDLQKFFNRQGHFLN